MAKNETEFQREPLRLPRRMTPTDSLFWYAETALPIFRPIIAGLYVLDQPPDRARFEAGVDAMLALVPRMRQRVAETPLPFGLPEWVDDPHFDRSYHLRHVSLPDPGGLRDLLDLAATVFATPLDRERPLWEAYWIDGLEGGRAAFFHKMHHSLVDGVGSIALLAALTQADRDEPVAGVAAEERPRRAPGPLERIARLAVDTGSQAARVAWQAAWAPARALSHPADTAESVWRTARGLRGLASDLSRPKVDDPLAEGSSGLSRRFDVMQVPLERLKKIKAPLGVTLNDLVLAVLAGTLRTYHLERGVQVATLNCMVPMNLRTRDEDSNLGNRVGTFNIVLPLDEEQPERRLARIAEQTRAAKEDKRGAAMPLLAEALPLVPGAALRWIARNSLGRVNVACTNIPGLKTKRYMAGAEVEAIYPFASVVEGTPLVIALLSYAGRMDIGIDTDPEAIPDPHRIAELFEAGLEEMSQLTTRHTLPERDKG